MRAALRFAVVAAIALLVIAHANEDFAEEDMDEEVETEAGKAFVLALQKCTDDAPWTIHGLWPQGRGKQWCKGKPALDASKLATKFVEGLAKAWPTCNGGSNSAFWEHEWKRHGSCSGLNHRPYLAKAMALKRSATMSKCKMVGKECHLCYDSSFQSIEC